MASLVMLVWIGDRAQEGLWDQRASKCSRSEFLCRDAPDALDDAIGVLALADQVRSPIHCLSASHLKAILFDQLNRLGRSFKGIDNARKSWRWYSIDQDKFVCIKK